MMPEKTRATTLLRPTAIAIHNDGHVGGCSFCVSVLGHE
jgi:hypothetical protein